MKESTLIKISLISSVLGIILILISNKIYEPETKKIMEITGKENSVQIYGNITSKFVSKQNNYFLKLKDETGTIDLVIFDNSIKNTDKLKNSTSISIIGKPSIYKGKLEIIVTELIV